MMHRCETVKKNVILGFAAGLSIATVGCGEEKPSKVPVTPVATATATVTATAVPLPPPAQAGACDSVMSAALQTAIQARAKQELSWGMKAEGL